MGNAPLCSIHVYRIYFYKSYDKLKGSFEYSKEYSHIEATRKKKSYLNILLF